MTDKYKRPDPDAILQSIKEDERISEKRGKLKIFFGMAAGVGKTYAMLEAAQRLRREGLDVVAGYIETHGRVETGELLRGLEIVPNKKIDYRGMIIEEFDIDAVLKRSPSIVLVDELAHTNPDGSRHNKRYQDVNELLDNGINVFSTLNVQHLESQADVVEKITGVKIRETLPDSILDLADEIELIDISPDDLLKRLAEGKVYVPEKAGLAAERFFRKGNLTALRELALHYTARMVGYELRDYTQKKNIKGPWKSGERLMVAISPSPYSEYLIRWTRRIAFNLNAPWIALYIEKQGILSASAQEILTRNLNLARELGAEVISTVDEDVVSGLLRIAQQKNITQIVVGKPLRRYLRDYFKGGNLVERLLKSSGDIEIHVVTQPDVGKKKPVPFTRIPSTLPLKVPLKEYLITAASITGVTLINLLLVQFTGYWTIALVFLLYIVILSLFIGRKPVLVAAGLSALIWNFLFIPPILTFRIARLEDVLMFGMYFVIANIIGGLTTKLRLKEQALRIREERITDLYNFSRALGTSFGLDEVISTAIVYIEDNFESRVAVMLSDESGNSLNSPHISSSLEISDDERGVAEWSFKNKKPAGLFTGTLPQKNAHYIPLIAPGSVVGVMGLRPASGTGFTLEQQGFLQNISYQLATRLERENLSMQNQKTLLLTESERLNKILLNTISHELRTPLTTITGASSGLLDEAIETRPEIRRQLIEEIGKAGNRLNRLVENLLDMSRLESGMLKLNYELHDAGDLISVVLRRLENDLKAHKVHVSVSNPLPLIRIDFALMEQAFSNLVYNAIVHTPAGTEISIEASSAGKTMNLIVRDNGPGLDHNDIPYLFEKFRRGSKSSSGGTGLGLSICRGIVEAHGGTVRAGNNRGGGAEFIIELPLPADVKQSPGVII